MPVWNNREEKPGPITACCTLSASQSQRTNEDARLAQESALKACYSETPNCLCCDWWVNCPVRGGAETYNTCTAGEGESEKFAWKNLYVDISVDKWIERQKAWLHDNRHNFIERRRGGKIEFGTECLFFLNKRAAILFLIKEIGCMIWTIPKTLFRKGVPL